MSGRAAVIVPAAGGGRRFGGVVKPLLHLAGEPLLVHALRPFLARSDVVAAVVALPASLAADPPPWLSGLDPRVTIVSGGAERVDSVTRGVEAVDTDVDILVVHDAARPLVTAAVVDRVMRVAYAGQGAVAAIPPTDTVHEVDPAGRIVATPDRRRLRRAQTPQAFPKDMLVRALRTATIDRTASTDEAGLVARCGGEVVVVDGDPDNVKVTVPSDLVLAEAVFAARVRP